MYYIAIAKKEKLRQEVFGEGTGRRPCTAPTSCCQSTIFYEINYCAFEKSLKKEHDSECNFHDAAIRKRKDDWKLST